MMYLLKGQYASVDLECLKIMLKLTQVKRKFSSKISEFLKSFAKALHILFIVPKIKISNDLYSSLT